jgi:hypothetical protein
MIRKEKTNQAESVTELILGERVNTSFFLFLEEGFGQEEW